MRRQNKRLLGALLVLGPGLALAQSANNENSADADPVLLAQAEGADPAAEYGTLLKETAGLEVYNELLERQIQAQQREIQSLRASLEQVPDLERQVPPLLLRMVEGLAEFVRLDLPFLKEEREERVANLQLLVERADVGEAEKFRRILEAWQIETEYGANFTTYQGEVTIDGEARTADFLQVGRVALLYQTRDDQARMGAWDRRRGDWIELGNENRNSVRRAVQIASNQVAPELVLLPLTPPE